MEAMEAAKAAYERSKESGTHHEGEGRKYLTFVLGEEEYGLEITRVQEIIGIMEITHIPQTPSFVKGVVNLRGKVIPIIDLRLKFGMEEIAYTDETCVIVVDRGNAEIGVVVDTVNEVLDINESDIDPAPTFGGKVDVTFILGMGKVQGKVKILLDIEKALADAHLSGVDHEPPHALAA